VLSFGATKNGALAAEAVVFFDTARVADFEFRRKRGAPSDLEDALRLGATARLPRGRLAGCGSPPVPTR
jgi:threonine aldolase